MTPQSEKYADGSAFTSVDDLRRREYYRPGWRANLMTINEGDTPMTDPSEPKGTLGRDQIDVPAFDFEVVRDGKAGIYAAIAGDREVAGLTYDVAGDDRLVLRATSVFPDFRKRGIATELIRRVLDDVRAQGKTVTAMCPIVHTFINNNPEYADLIDPEHPGMAKGLPPSAKTLGRDCY